MDGHAGGHEDGQSEGKNGKKYYRGDEIREPEYFAQEWIFFRPKGLHEDGIDTGHTGPESTRGAGGLIGGLTMGADSNERGPDKQDGDNDPEAYLPPKIREWLRTQKEAGKFSPGEAESVDDSGEVIPVGSGVEQDDGDELSDDSVGWREQCDKEEASGTGVPYRISYDSDGIARHRLTPAQAAEEFRRMSHAQAVGDDEFLNRCDPCGLIIGLIEIVPLDFLISRTRKSIPNLTIAVDFDGVLVRDDYPEMGYVIRDPLWGILKTLSFMGVSILFWSCRSGQKEQEAVKILEKVFSRVSMNTNSPGRVRLFGSDPRKLSADLYIDNHALGFPARDVEGALLKWIYDEVVGVKIGQKESGKITLRLFRRPVEIGPRVS